MKPIASEPLNRYEPKPTLYTYYSRETKHGRSQDFCCEAALHSILSSNPDDLFSGQCTH